MTDAQAKVMPARVWKDLRICTSQTMLRLTPPACDSRGGPVLLEVFHMLAQTQDSSPIAVNLFSSATFFPV